MKADIATNRLLDTLPNKDLQRILASCERVELVSGDILHEAGTRLRHVYFPTGGFISLVTPLDACAGLEIALVGDEGMVGVSLSCAYQCPHDTIWSKAPAAPGA